MLKKLSNILKNEKAIFINGQSGDFITGNHIPEKITYFGDDLKKREDHILSLYIDKHYKHWSKLNNRSNIESIKSLLKDEIKNLGGLSNFRDKDYGLYEYLEYIDRQSKYVVNGQRNYEYFGMNGGYLYGIMNI